jgi:hypothetical protein
MTRSALTTVALSAALLVGTGTAEAVTVVEVTGGGALAVSEPALSPAYLQPAPPPGPASRRPRRNGAGPPAPATAAGKKGASDPVTRTISKLGRHGALEPSERAAYLASWRKALSAERRLGGQRRAELAYVTGLIRRLARERRLAARLRPTFLVLDRNREWWSRSGPPASGARLRFGASRVIFQYFPGKGLQFHPLANFGQLNGYWYAKRDRDLRSLAQDLAGLAVRRSGFLAWEYYFDFDGGSPPWISGMAQGTAMQALARAGERLADPLLVETARGARGAFERRTPVGVRAPQGDGVWYPLYSFAPRLNVLNGMLQAVNGLRTYAEIADDQDATALFRAGDRTARRVIARYDTGAWSLYSRPSGRPGPEASLNYHTLNRDFARNLCRATQADAYCSAAADFTRYLKEGPRLDDARAVPAPAVGGRGVRFAFRLSKIAQVGIVVRDGTVQGAGRIRLATSAGLTRGEHWFRWVPPRSRRERTYSYTLHARDLAGNTGAESGTLRVERSRHR